MIKKADAKHFDEALRCLKRHERIGIYARIASASTRANFREIGDAYRATVTRS